MNLHEHLFEILAAVATAVFGIIANLLKQRDDRQEQKLVGIGQSLDREREYREKLAAELQEKLHALAIERSEKHYTKTETDRKFESLESMLNRLESKVDRISEAITRGRDA